LQRERIRFERHLRELVGEFWFLDGCEDIPM
jgi:hypothetical protein